MGVRPARVRALVASGRLLAHRIGHEWLLDADSVDAQAAMTSAGATGRSMAQRIAWAAADLADGGSAKWLAPNERHRLRRRLASGAPPAVVQRWLAHRADEVSRYRAGAGDLGGLLSDERVVRTGVSAARGYALPLAEGHLGDAYVDRDTAETLVRDLYLIPSAQGNLTLRIVGSGWHLASARIIGGERFAPRLVAGVDLAEDRDARTHSAGISLISDALPDLEEAAE